jgi:hypothetical protein
MKDILAYRQKLQKSIDDKTLKYMKSFEFYYDKDGYPHFSFSIIDSSEKAHVEDDNIKVKGMLSEFGLSDEHIRIDYELSSGDFQPAMMTSMASEEDEKSVVADWKCISNPGSASEGTLSRGIMIKLKPNNLKGIEKIIPNLDITKDIYANVGASHTAPRILKIHRSSYLPSFIVNDLIARELNVAGQSFNVKKKYIHLYNDLDIFLIRNETDSFLKNQFEELNTFKFTFKNCNGEKRILKGNIAQIWSDDVNNKVLEIGDEVYFIGRHNKSYGTVTSFPS